MYPRAILYPSARLLGCTLFVFIRLYLLASNVIDYYIIPAARWDGKGRSAPLPWICSQDSGSTCRLLCQLSLISKCPPVRTKVAAPFWMIQLVERPEPAPNFQYVSWPCWNVSPGHINCYCLCVPSPGLRGLAGPAFLKLAKLCHA